MRRFLLLLVTVCCCQLYATDPQIRKKPTRGLLVGLGRAHQLDTYLSPIAYKGPQFALLQEGKYEVFWFHGRWELQSMLEVNASATRMWKDSSIERWGGDIHYDAYLLKHVYGRRMRYGLNIDVGGGIGGTLGGTYATRGGNNPSQAHLQLRLSATVNASYSFKLWNRDWTARYQADLPLIGGMFSPNYGQSYYEIFSRGNYDHNIVLTHPFKAPNLRQLALLEIPLKKGSPSLRIAYLSDIRQATPNHLKQHQISRSFMIGFVKYIRTKW